MPAQVGLAGVVKGLGDTNPGSN